ncbi:MAG: peptidoglycan-binding domain-containing protein [Vicinamibacterales bacterium]
MPPLTYRQPDLVLRRQGGPASDRQIRDLQRDLRQLGYLKRGIDGRFGSGTERAVKALQHDLLRNNGTGRDGNAAVSIKDLNAQRVTAITGEADQALVECISDLLDDPRVGKLPAAANPRQENQRVLDALAAMSSDSVPIPFLLAILTQESGLKHFNEPKPGDEDTFITIGLDAVPTDSEVITSRGYGAGQFTLFHHPPRPEEVTDVMTDVQKNVGRAIGELREKFNRFVNGPADRAQDRIVEAGAGPLRECRFAPGTPERFTDCATCLRNAGTVSIVENETAVHAGSTVLFHSTSFYDMRTSRAFYTDVPRRAGFECDWPYAARRYNGGGINSYHYQVRILKHLAGGTG